MKQNRPRGKAPMHTHFATSLLPLNIQCRAYAIAWEEEEEEEKAEEEEKGNNGRGIKEHAMKWHSHSHADCINAAKKDQRRSWRQSAHRIHTYVRPHLHLHPHPHTFCSRVIWILIRKDATHVSMRHLATQK